MKKEKDIDDLVNEACRCILNIIGTTGAKISNLNDDYYELEKEKLANKLSQSSYNKKEKGIDVSELVTKTIANRITSMEFLVKSIIASITLTIKMNTENECKSIVKSLANLCPHNEVTKIFEEEIIAEISKKSKESLISSLETVIKIVNDTDFCKTPNTDSLKKRGENVHLKKLY